MTTISVSTIRFNVPTSWMLDLNTAAQQRGSQNINVLLEDYCKTLLKNHRLEAKVIAEMKKIDTAISNRE